MFTTDRGAAMIPEGVTRVAAPEATLSVDSFTYFERLAHIPGFPPLIYTWIVDAILLDTTPPEQGGWGQREAGPRTFVSVEATDAWSNGSAEYVLECTLLDVPPKWDSATAVGF